MALVHDEYGHFEGVVTPADALEAIVGAFRSDGEAPEPDAVRREDGSWLLAGSMPVDEMAEILGVSLPESRSYHTVGGLVISELQHLPTDGRACGAIGWRFEVIDLDERRIDKVLAVAPQRAGAAPPRHSVAGARISRDGRRCRGRPRSRSCWHRPRGITMPSSITETVLWVSPAGIAAAHAASAVGDDSRAILHDDVDRHVVAARRSADAQKRPSPRRRPAPWSSRPAGRRIRGRSRPGQSGCAAEPASPPPRSLNAPSRRRRCRPSGNRRRSSQLAWAGGTGSSRRIAACCRPPKPPSPGRAAPVRADRPSTASAEPAFRLNPSS